MILSLNGKKDSMWTQWQRLKKKKRWTPKKESEMRWIQKWMLYHSIRVCWWATNEALSFQEGIRKRESWSVTSPLWPANLWQGQAAYGWFWDRRVPLSPLWKTPSRKPCIAFHCTWWCSTQPYSGRAHRNILWSNSAAPTNHFGQFHTGILVTGLK